MFRLAFHPFVCLGIVLGLILPAAAEERRKLRRDRGKWFFMARPFVGRFGGNLAGSFRP